VPFPGAGFARKGTHKGRPYKVSSVSFSVPPW
jgi:hypothetical protein